MKTKKMVFFSHRKFTIFILVMTESWKFSVGLICNFHTSQRPFYSALWSLKFNQAHEDFLNLPTNDHCPCSDSYSLQVPATSFSPFLFFFWSYLGVIAIVACWFPLTLIYRFVNSPLLFPLSVKSASSWEPNWHTAKYWTAY